MLHTTFRLAQAHNACKDSYERFARHVGGVAKYGEDTPIPLTDVLDVLGLGDALWCLQVVLPEEEAERDRLVKLLACDYAEHVLHVFESQFPDDARPRQCIEVARRYAVGEASMKELNDAAAEVAWAAWAAAEVDLTAGPAARAAWAAWAAAMAAFAAAEADLTAGPAARAAAEAIRAARDARDAEREWQTDRFREVLREAGDNHA